MSRLRQIEMADCPPSRVVAWEADDCILRLMRSVIFIASPFRRLRKARGDEAEHIAFPNHIDDIEQWYSVVRPMQACRASTSGLASSWWARGSRKALVPVLETNAIGLIVEFRIALC